MEKKVRFYLKQVDGKFHFSGDKKNWMAMPETVKSQKDAERWTRNMADFQWVDADNNDAMRFVVKYSSNYVFAATPDGKITDIPLTPYTPTAKVAEWLEQHAAAAGMAALVHFENEPMTAPEPEEEE